jgi:signal transduction histidine kinase
MSESAARLESLSREELLARLVRVEAQLREMSVVSHKINNPITALLGRAQMLRSRAHSEPLVEKSVLVIDESAARITELAKELSKLLKEARRDFPDSAPALDAHEPVGASTR